MYILVFFLGVFLGILMTSLLAVNSSEDEDDEETRLKKIKEDRIIRGD